MRICILSDSRFVPACNLVRHLVEEGHEVDALGFGEVGFPAPARAHRIPAPGRLGLLLARPAVRRLIRSIRPDVVHAFYLTSYGYLASGVRGIPVLATALGSDVFGAPDLSYLVAPIRTALARRAIRRADLIHSVAEHMTERLVALGADPAKVVTFPRGVSLARFVAGARPDPPERPYRLLCNRKLEPVYDHATLLEGVARLLGGGAPISLRLVGAGYLRPRLEEQARRLAIADRVTFEGNIPHQAMPGVLAASDLFVTASLSDGTSSCLLEALAAGCIPVASDIPANRPWLRDGTNGFLFRTGDPESLADAVGRALSAERSWPAMRRANRSLVESRGSMEEGHRRVVELYRRLASPR